MTSGLAFLGLGGGLLVSCASSEDAAPTAPTEPAPVVDESQPESPLEFTRTEVYRWPGSSTVVWSIEGGELDGEPTLLVSEARFAIQDGKPALRPATLEVLTPHEDGWKSETLTDKEGAVFHKAILHDGGILTISGGIPGSGQPAMFKHWKRSGSEGQWQFKRIWVGSWSGNLNRIRDFEIGDVDGDGLDEVVLGTHDQGVIAILDGVLDDSEESVSEQAQEADRYIHEIELGDLDGDGTQEIFASRSEPNISARSQAGTIEMLRFDGSSYVQQEIWTNDSTHVKEILAADMDGDGRTEVFAAVEAVRQGSERLSDVEVLQLGVAEDGSFSWRPLVQLADEGLRFMVAHDVNGGGSKELFLSPKNSGLYLASWSATEPATLQHFETRSGGFEHAIQVLDIDRDGRSELYVADDRQKAIFRYQWEG